MVNSCADAQVTRTKTNLLLGNRNYFGFFKRGDADYTNENSWFHESAGFTASTANDMGKYLQMYLRRGKTANGVSIISKENQERMWYDNVENPWDKVTRYGMGWNYQYEQGIKMVFHGGQVENYLL